MKLSRFLYCSLVIAVLSAGVSFQARASDADVLRQSQDRAEIEALMWRYVRALDTLNEDAYAEVFTPDGQFGTGEKAAKGRDALRKVVTDVKKGRAEREAKGEPKSPPMHHVITNAHVEFIDKDHARYHSYWMTVFAGSPGGTAPRVAAAGRGVDELVRLNGKWLIKSRNVSPQD
jgi:uncharacterized protein (TIGR02246 family)